MILPGMLDGSANSNLPTTEIGELNCIERARTFVNELTVHAFTLKSTYIITYRIWPSYEYRIGLHIVRVNLSFTLESMLH